MRLDNINTLGVIGDRHTCKTNLMFYLAKNYKGSKEKYLLGYPIKMQGFTSINTLSELSMVTEGLVLCDEIQKVIPFYSKRMNDTLLEVLSTMAHNENSFIFSTCLSQFITKALDGFIDGFCYTKIQDLAVLKNGSKAKRRLSEFSHSKVNQWSLNLKKGEYIEIIDNNEIGSNGLKKFPNQRIKKDWKAK